MATITAPQPTPGASGGLTWRQRLSRFDVRSAPYLYIAPFFVLFAISPIWGFLVALAAGVLVTGFLVVGFKRFIAPKELEAAEADLAVAAVPA